MDANTFYQQAQTIKTTDQELYLINLHKAADLDNQQAIQDIHKLAYNFNNLNFNKGETQSFSLNPMNFFESFKDNCLNNLIQFDSTKGYVSTLIGYIYEQGFLSDGKKDEAMAIKYYTIGISKGCTIAALNMHSIALKYENKKQIKDIQTAIDIYLIISDTYALLKIGDIYMELEKDPSRTAFTYYKMVIDRTQSFHPRVDKDDSTTTISDRSADIVAVPMDDNYLDHIFRVIERYRGKIKLSSNTPGGWNRPTSIHYYQMLADKGHIESQYKIGNLNFKSYLAETNRYINAKQYRWIYIIKPWLITALKYFNLVVENSYGYYKFKAAYKLGYMYYHGLIVLFVNESFFEPNYTKALEYYKIAEEGEYLSTFLKLGHMYRKGKGVLRDIYTAIRYYTTIIDANDVKKENVKKVLYDKAMKSLTKIDAFGRRRMIIRFINENNMLKQQIADLKEQIGDLDVLGNDDITISGVKRPSTTCSVPSSEYKTEIIQATGKEPQRTIIKKDTTIHMKELKQLEDENKYLHAEICELKAHLKYHPGAIGYLETKQHFEGLVQS